VRQVLDDIFGLKTPNLHNPQYTVTTVLYDMLHACIPIMVILTMHGICVVYAWSIVVKFILILYRPLVT